MPAASLTSRARAVRRRFRRAVLARRRLLAALLTGAAVLAAVRATSPPPPPTVEVLVAARDLPAGEPLTPADLRATAIDPAAVPDGLVTDPVGRLLATPLRRGEVVTDARLLGPGLAEGFPGRALVPVRFPDADSVALLRPGDRVEVIATDPREGTATTVAAGALVAAVPPAGDHWGATTTGRLVVLAVAPGDVASLGAAQVQSFLSFALPSVASSPSSNV